MRSSSKKTWRPNGVRSPTKLMGSLRRRERRELVGVCLTGHPVSLHDHPVLGQPVELVDDPRHQVLICDQEQSARALGPEDNAERNFVLHFVGLVGVEPQPSPLAKKGCERLMGVFL